MKKNNKNIVSEKEIDNLLNQAFLKLDFNQPKNQKIMETIANYTLTGAAVQPPTVHKFLVSNSPYAKTSGEIDSFV